MTAEIIAEHPEYHPGDMAGLSGLQARYDERLRGTPGVAGPGRAREGQRRASCSAPRRRPATRSCSPSTSASRPRPRSCSPASARPARWWRSGPSTGEILAAANGPGNGGQNLATFGQAAPGSTFKTVSSLALLRAGLTPDTVGALHPHDHGGRQGVQELLRLPEQRARRHPAADRASPTRATPRSSRRPPKLSGTEPVRRRRSRSASGSTTTSASRRTSARPTPTPRARPARPRS